MKRLRSFLPILLSLIFVISAVSGCGNSKSGDSSSDKDNAAKTEEKEEPPVTCPFTELDWKSSFDDMVALEGSDYKTYDSVYKGTTYTYPKKYKDLDGTIKYMYDADNKLMCVAWVYSSDTDEILLQTYDTIHKEVEDTFGKSGYNADSATNYGDVWYLDGGHIILSVMATEAQKALQYSYQNPVVSEEDAASSQAK